MRYLKSECLAGYLHKFSIIQELRGGLVERCERCGIKMFFPHNTPNWKYMETHVRQALQANDPRFKKEYPNINI